MSATTQEKRARRVERRAIPEVVEAVRSGKLSIRLADQLLYLPKTEQKSELTRRLKAVEDRERISALVAQTIRQYLDTTSKVDLQELNERIREALA
jgi:Asp-tRNA(Asn)/Glu-tRNA(Gln) amidotransferase B subunit